MEKVIFGIQVKRLSKEDLEMFSDVIVQSNEIIHEECKNVYGECSPRNLRKFHSEYRNGKVKSSPSLKEAIDVLHDVEGVMLQNFTPMIYSLALKVSKKTTTPILDLFQESCLAFVDCVYSYDGKSQLSTYSYVTITNRLKDYVRHNHPLSPPGRNILKFIQMIKKSMDKKNLSFDEAVKELKLDKKKVMVCQSVMRPITYLADHLNSAFDIPSKQKNDMSFVYEAIENANLSKKERELIDCFMLGEKNFQTRIAKESNLTKAAVSARFVQAKKKVKNAILKIMPEYAAA